MPLNINDPTENLPEEKPVPSEIVPSPPENKQNISRFAAIFFAVIVLAAAVFLLYTYDILPLHKSNSSAEQIAQSRSAQANADAEEDAREAAAHQHPVTAPKDSVMKPAVKEQTAPAPTGKPEVSKETAVKQPENKKVTAIPAPAKEIAQKPLPEKQVVNPKTSKIPVEKPVTAKKSEAKPATPVEKKAVQKSVPTNKIAPPQKPVAVHPSVKKSSEQQHKPAGIAKSAIPTATKGRLALYIASYHDRKDAEDEVARWRDAGFDAFVSDAGDWHRVALGRFGSVADAKKQVDTLKQAFEYGYWIGPC